MENNFFVGDIFYGKKLGRQKHIEKCVLYSDDNYNYLDLINGRWYTIDVNDRDYVITDSIRTTDINQYRENYLYLLDKHKKSIKKRIIS